MEILFIAMIVTFLFIGMSNKDKEKKELKRISDEFKATQLNNNTYETERTIRKGGYEETINPDLYYDKSGDYESSEQRGMEAEYLVRSKLEKLNYPQYHNFTFKINGEIYKIDHLILSPKGFYIIETKRWRGSVILLDKSETVKVRTRKYGTKEYQNPIIELSLIKQALIEITDSKANDFKLAIMFVDSSDISSNSRKAKSFNSLTGLEKFLKYGEKKVEKSKINKMIVSLNGLYEPISREQYYRIKHN
jgi:hypothetical protein